MNRLTWLHNPDQLAFVMRTQEAGGIRSGIHLWRSPESGRLTTSDDAIVIARPRLLFSAIAPFGSGRALVRQLQGNSQDYLLWDMMTQQPLNSLHRSTRPTERLIAHRNGYFLRWDRKAGGGFVSVSEGATIRTRLPHVLCANWSLDGSAIISASTDETDILIEVFLTDSGQQVAELPWDAPVLELAMSADQQLLAVRSPDHVTILQADGQIINRLDHRAKMILWHPSEATLFIASDDLWIVTTSDTHRMTLEGQVQEMVMTADPTHLACLLQVQMPDSTKQDHIHMVKLNSSK